MTAADAAGVLAIYQRGLDSGPAGFETTAPDWAGFEATHLPEHRFVAEHGGMADGALLAWVAVSPTSSRAVYAGVVELSIYVDEAARGRGLGRQLIGRLLESTASGGIWTVQATVFAENAASLRLHERAGFRVVGVRERIGRRDGRWRDTVLLERRAPTP